jgi:hypothetical protein
MCCTYPLSHKLLMCCTYPLSHKFLIQHLKNLCDRGRDFNKGRHPAICRRFKRVISPVRLLETKIFVH